MPLIDKFFVADGWHRSEMKLWRYDEGFGLKRVTFISVMFDLIFLTTKSFKYNNLYLRYIANILNILQN